MSTAACGHSHHIHMQVLLPLRHVIADVPAHGTWHMLGQEDHDSCLLTDPRAGLDSQSSEKGLRDMGPVDF